MSIPIQTKVTNKYNANVSSKQIDGRVTKTGREKMERVAREGRDQFAPSILLLLWQVKENTASPSSLHATHGWEMVSYLLFYDVTNCGRDVRKGKPEVDTWCAAWPILSDTDLVSYTQLPALFFFSNPPCNLSVPSSAITSRSFQIWKILYHWTRLTFYFGSDLPLHILCSHHTPPHHTTLTLYSFFLEHSFQDRAWMLQFRRQQISSVGTAFTLRMWNQSSKGPEGWVV